jgi:hypothetical protein
MRSEPELLQRNLVHLVVEFARMPRPLDASCIEEHFIRHPWFRVAPNGARAIKGISAAPERAWPMGPAEAPSLDRWGVASASIVPAHVLATAVASVRIAHEWTAPLGTVRAPFDSDQDEVRRLLRMVVDREDDEVHDWIDATVSAHPDLVGAVFDWDTLEPQTWLAGVQGACVLAITILSQNMHRIAEELRWCDGCGPWMPTSGGRPTDRCECGRPRRRLRPQGRRARA